jgi:hypothetical protein
MSILPVCMNCVCEMRCIKNEVQVVSGFFKYDDGKQGGVRFSGDAYQCDSCGSRIITGYGKRMENHDIPISPMDSAISLDDSFPPQNIPEKNS